MIYLSPFRLALNWGIRSLKRAVATFAVLVAATSSLTPAPSLSVNRQGEMVEIAFAGTLQQAATLAGPWVDRAGLSSPLRTNSVGSGTFYRARQPDSLFSSAEPVELTLTAPFQPYFELAYAGLPDGIFPPVREKPYFEGNLQMPGFMIPIDLRVRGNSSLQECPFPKLKFKVSRVDREDTPFADAREVKIGTHCAEGGRGTIGRLRDQTATYREVLAYEALAAMGFVVPRVRRALIDYRDNTPPEDSSAGGWELSRQALLLEDIEVVAARMGGRALDDDEISGVALADLDPQLVTDLQFFNALIGNWDYRFPFESPGVWNIDVVQLADGSLLPVAGDFDLASWVTGVVRLMAPGDYHPELPELNRQALYELEQVRQRSESTSFAAARDRFVDGRAGLQVLVQSAQMDDAGRTNCLQHLDAFYGALEQTARWSP